MAGKYGDILSVLPIVHAHSKMNGSTPSFMVARDFASLLDGCSYVKPVVFDDHFSKLSKAYQTAKRRFSSVIVPQVYGKDFPIEKRTPSFQLDQWMRCGALEHFYEWPLVIDQRNKAREAELLNVMSEMGQFPYILLADHSESSPFRGKNELAALLREEFKSHTVIRLSEIRAAHFRDFLALYERADAIVAVESAHLHLARAVNTPVVALVADEPSRWHGSAWHPRFALHCRYKDFESRRGELVRALRDAIAGKKQPVLTQIKTLFQHGYNPSTLQTQDGALTVYRYHPTGDWKTQLAIKDGVREQWLQPPPILDGLSIEDGRLFMWKGEPHISYVAATSDRAGWRSIIGYGPLVKSEGQWRIGAHNQVNFANNNWYGLEKNWVPFEHDGHLFFIYGSEPQQTVIRVVGEKVANVFHSDAVRWEYGEIRGGSVIPWGDKLLRFFHSHGNDKDRARWIYRVGCALMEAKPPFRTIAVCKHPIIAGDEHWTPNCRRWKQNIAFAGGVIQDGDGWKLSFGHNDCASMTVNLTGADLNL